MTPQMPPVSGGFKPAAPGTPGSPFHADGTLKTPETRDSDHVEPPHWQRWWHYNRDSYLNLSALLSGMDTRTTAEGGVDPAVQIAPLLQRALMTGGETQLIRGSLLALARMPAGDTNRQALPLSSATKHFLSADHPASREAAVIALGLGAESADLDKLLGLFRSNELGQELIGDELVDPRTRAFAAYSMALFAQRTTDAAAQEQIGRALLEVLILDERATFELHNACVLALGLVPLPACDGTEVGTTPPLGDPASHICVGVQLGILNTYYKDDEHYPALRAHAAPALARLADGRLPEYKEDVCDSMFEMLDTKSKADAELQEGAVIALGILGDSDNDALDKKIRQTLQRVATKGDDLTSRLAMVSLARVCARAGENRPYAGLDKSRAWLQRQVTKSDLGRDSWAAMSLAILAHDLVENGQAVPEDIVATLRSSLKRTKDDDLATSLCISLGLLRDQDSVELFTQRFVGSNSDDVRGAAALGLGLLEARETIPSLQKALLRDEENVGVVRQTAIALRLMGDTTTTTALLERLGKAEETSDKATIVSTLGILHDPRAVSAVASILGDEEADDELRGVAAFALAELADKSAQSWSEPLSTDLTYSMLAWTLESPFGDGSGVLDMRWW